MQQLSALFVCLAMGACTELPTPNVAPFLPRPDLTCDTTVLYGTPGERTGLDQSTCAPRLGVDTPWTPRTWTDEALQALRDAQHLNPPEAPPAGAYALPVPPAAPEDAVCAVIFESPTTYRTETVAYTAEGGLTVPDAIATHGGACGQCSSLEDLAVYAGISDLTDPVRQCALRGVLGDLSNVAACLEDLGFTPGCADIWAQNAENTQAVCFDDCISLYSADYHLADGSLNACLQCDEDLSGDVFKAIAGRTRRNSGLATALCRPCDTVWRIDHAYP